MSGYIKIPKETEDEYAEGRGCEDSQASSFYSFTGPRMVEKVCFGFYSKMSKHALSKYQEIQHYLLEGRCKTGKCLCVRYPDYDMNDQVVVVEHIVGKCPMSVYDRR